VVNDAAEAFRISTENGGVPVAAPVTRSDPASGTSLTWAEIKLYGDCVLRFVSGDFQGPYLPGYEPVTDSPQPSFGLQRLDHAVGNVPQLMPQVRYMARALGWHEFAEFTAEDVGTVDSGLNSMVMANNNEMILLPVNEPTFGTKRKSQIQTFLEQNEGPGLQHMALKTDDIFSTMRQIRARSAFGGFGFMPRPSDDYYRKLPQKIGDVLSPQQYKEVEELGLLVDKDDQGVLLQIFTKPLGDRPTVFFEIIQRLCALPPPQVTPTADGGVSAAAGAGFNVMLAWKRALGRALAAVPPVPIDNTPPPPLFLQAEPAAHEAKSQRTLVPAEVGGCGGFGKGNFRWDACRGALGCHFPLSARRRRCLLACNCLLACACLPAWWSVVWGHRCLPVA
jgi:4-hydroxyphenylpyruvate dioxygenase